MFVILYYIVQQRLVSLYPSFQVEKDKVFSNEKNYVGYVILYSNRVEFVPYDGAIEEGNSWTLTFCEYLAQS